MGPALECDWYPVSSHWRTDFSSPRSDQLWMSSFWGMVLPIQFSSVLGSVFCRLSQCLWVRMRINPVVHGKHCILEVIHPSGLHGVWLPFCIRPWAWKEGVWYRHPVQVWALPGPSVSISYQLWASDHQLLQEETSLMRTGQCAHLKFWLEPLSEISE